jgi:16S rRNA (cytidine1402-2'-O)-methyltransferase
MENGVKTTRVQEIKSGLYLVSTPLGNLGDISLRAKEVIKLASLVAAEDTRRSLKLLNFLDLKRPLISYREETHQKSWQKIHEVLKQDGIVALLTDAGSPAISDPGAALVREARSHGFSVFPIPGPSAVISALTASGFSLTGFTFAGFPPPKAGKRRSFLLGLKEIKHPIVFFEAPHRLEETLEDILSVFGQRKAFLAREMTKIHEEYLFLDLAGLLEDVRNNPRKGEITLVVEGSGSGTESLTEEPISIEELELKLRQDEKLIKDDPRPTTIVAKDWALSLSASRHDVYRIITKIRQED